MEVLIKYCISFQVHRPYYIRSCSRYMHRCRCRMHIPWSTCCSWILWGIARSWISNSWWDFQNWCQNDLRQSWGLGHISWGWGDRRYWRIYCCWLQRWYRDWSRARNDMWSQLGHSDICLLAPWWGGTSYSWSPAHSTNNNSWFDNFRSYWFHNIFLDKYN